MPATNPNTGARPVNLRTPTPEQIHRRQLIIAMVLLIGIPLINALLSRYGLPPIVVPTTIVQPATPSPTATNWIEDQPRTLLYCSSNEIGIPLNLDRRTPVRTVVRWRFQRERGIIHRIYSRRHPSASAAAQQYPPLPAREAPAATLRGCGPWCE